MLLSRNQISVSPLPPPPQAIINDRSSTANSRGTICEPEMKVESKYLGNLSFFKLVNIWSTHGTKNTFT